MRILTTSRILWFFTVLAKLLERVSSNSIKEMAQIDQQSYELERRRTAAVMEEERASRAAARLKSLIDG